MEVPKYRLDFEIDAYYDIKEDIEIEMFNHSKIILCRSKTTNKGAIFFEKDMLDQNEAKIEGMSKVDYFINCLLVASNIDDMMPLRFPKPVELLNPEKFKRMTKTISKSFTIGAGLVALLEKTPVETANVFMKKMSCLEFETQTAIKTCLFWLRRGAETRKDERFMYRWISLEALLGILKQEYSSTQKMISVLLNTFLTNEKAKNIFEENEKTVNGLANANLVGWNGAKRSEKLKRTLQQRADFKAIITKAALCIFEVRNRLFHRGEEMTLIPDCNSILRDLINTLLVSIFTRKESQNVL